MPTAYDHARNNSGVLQFKQMSVGHFYAQEQLSARLTINCPRASAGGVARDFSQGVGELRRSASFFGCSRLTAATGSDSLSNPPVATHRRQRPPPNFSLAHLPHSPSPCEKSREMP